MTARRAERGRRQNTQTAPAAAGNARAAVKQTIKKEGEQAPAPFFFRPSGGGQGLFPARRNGGGIRRVVGGVAPVPKPAELEVVRADGHRLGDRKMVRAEQVAQARTQHDLHGVLPLAQDGRDVLFRIQHERRVPAVRVHVRRHEPAADLQHGGAAPAVGKLPFQREFAFKEGVPARVQPLRYGRQRAPLCERKALPDGKIALQVGGFDRRIVIQAVAQALRGERVEEREIHALVLAERKRILEHVLPFLHERADGRLGKVHVERALRKGDGRAVHRRGRERRLFHDEGERHRLGEGEGLPHPHRALVVLAQQLFEQRRDRAARTERPALPRDLRVVQHEEIFGHARHAERGGHVGSALPHGCGAALRAQQDRALRPAEHDPVPRERALLQRFKVERDVLLPRAFDADAALFRARKVFDEQEFAALPAPRREHAVPVLTRKAVPRGGADLFERRVRGQGNVLLFPVDVTDLPEHAQPAAERLQQRAGVCRQRAHGRHDDGIVAAAAQPQAAPFRAAAPRKQPFVEEMIGDPVAAQRAKQVAERVLRLFHALVIFLAQVIQPDAADGVDNADLVLVLRFRHDAPEPREIVVEGAEPFEPVPLRRKDGWMVGLSPPRERIRVQVLAHLVHAVEVLVLRDALQFLGRHVVPRAAERFGQHELFAQLRCRAAHLPRRKLGAAVPPQPVDAGDMLELVRRHDRRAAPHLPEQQALLHGMPRQFAAVRFAPVVQFFIEVLRIQPVERIEVLFAEGIAALALHEQPDEPVADVLAVLGEFRLRHGRVGRAPAVILRLVREKARKLLPEPIFELRIIFFVRFGDERIHHGGIEDIGVRGADAQVHVVILRLARLLPFDADESPAAAHEHGERRRVERAFRVFEVARAERLVFQKFSAHEPARPAVFVVHPRLHAERLRLVEAGLDAREPLFAEVFLLQPRPRVHDEPADARRLHVVDLAAQLRLVQAVVPRPERDAPVRL